MSNSRSPAHRSATPTMAVRGASRNRSAHQQRVVLERLAARIGGTCATRSSTSSPVRSSPSTSKHTFPSCSIMVRVAEIERLAHRVGHHQRRQAAARRRSRGSARARTRPSPDRAPRCARRAAGLRRRQRRHHQATAWRWPPESSPMRSSRRFSSPRPSSARRARGRRPAARRQRARRSPRRRPRAAASARFSSIVSASQLPASGSWKTRATMAARAGARHARDVAAVDRRCGPPLGRDVAGERVEQRRLAGAVASRSR